MGFLPHIVVHDETLTLTQHNPRKRTKKVKFQKKQALFPLDNRNQPTKSISYT